MLEIERIQICELWEDKFGYVNVTTVEDHYPNKYSNDSTNVEAVVKRLLPYLKERGEIVGTKLNIL